MKIALISCFYSPRIGGIEKYTEQLANQLSKSDQVTVFTSEPTLTPEAASTQNIKLLPTHKIGKYLFPKFFQTYTVINSTKPDIIHLNGPLPYSTIIGFIAKMLHIPTVITYHGDANPTHPLIKLASWIDKQIYRFLFSKIIVTSKKYHSRVSNFFPAQNIKTIPLAIEDHFFTTPNKQTSRQELNLSLNKAYILFVGKIDQNHYYKGLQTLLESSKDNPDVSFLIIGSGNQLEQHISAYSSQTNIKFLGKIPAEVLPKYFSAADATVLPSNSSSEGFGIVLLESAACSTPVITTSVVGSSEFISKNECGIIIPPNSPQKLSQAINQLISNPKLHKTLSQNCRKTVDNMKWKNTAAQTLEVYKSL